MLYSLLFIVKPVIFAPESLIAVTMLSGKPLYVNLTVTVSADSIAASVGIPGFPQLRAFTYAIIGTKNTK